MPSEASFKIRRAVPADSAAIATLIDHSVRGLQQHDYSPAQIDGALGTVFGVDSQLIADGTYFVVEAIFDDGTAALVGCGGWSKRKTLFGSDRRAGRDDELLDPRHDSARIRAFFVHPDWARRGLGSMILTACENAAIEAGFQSFELGATLTGEKLYVARGYKEMERIEVPLSSGVTLPIIRMSKARLGSAGTEGG